MRELLSDLIRALKDGEQRIVCQVIETRGSTPQKAGSMMILAPNGAQSGTLGGGCVENEVKQNAIRRLGEPGAAIASFVLDHDYAWADGLICGGKMVILSEAIQGTDALAYFESLADLHALGDGLTEVVVADPERAGVGPIGSRFLFDASAQFVRSWPEQPCPTTIREIVAPVVERPKTAAKSGLCILPTLPRIRLLIVGAGHVGQAVGELAAQADFDVWVVDDRSQYANTERFPGAQKILVGPIDEVLPSLEIHASTYALIVTRGHGHDQESLYYLAPTAATYVGLIGSRRKIRLIFENLREQGISQAVLDRVTAPVGIDIGSQSVTEIAISIVAQLIAKRNLGGTDAKVVTAVEQEA